MAHMTQTHCGAFDFARVCRWGVRMSTCCVTLCSHLCSRSLSLYYHNRSYKRAASSSSRVLVAPLQSTELIGTLAFHASEEELKTYIIAMDHQKRKRAKKSCMCSVAVGLFFLLHLASLNSGVQAQCSAAESQALVTFRSLVLDPRDDIASWGPAGGDCCKWRGIQCAQSGVVAIVLELQQPIRGRTVTLDPNNPDAIAKAGDALAKLVHLLVLRTDWVVWSGPFPFSKLKNLPLREISIRNGNLAALENKFGGGIPNEIGAFPYLEVLALTGTRFTTGLPSAVCQLKRLRFLEISDSFIAQSVGPACLGSLQDLEEVRLNNNPKVTVGLPVWPTNLRKLKILDLSGNSHSGNIPAQYGKLSSTVQLFLAGNKLSGRIPPGLSTKPVSTFRPGNPSLCGPPLPNCPT